MDYVSRMMPESARLRARFYSRVPTPTGEKRSDDVTDAKAEGSSSDVDENIPDGWVTVREETL